MGFTDRPFSSFLRSSQRAGTWKRSLNVENVKAVVAV